MHRIVDRRITTLNTADYLARSVDKSLLVVEGLGKAKALYIKGIRIFNTGWKLK